MTKPSQNAAGMGTDRLKMPRQEVQDGADSGTQAHPGHKVFGSAFGSWWRGR